MPVRLSIDELIPPSLQHNHYRHQRHTTAMARSLLLLSFLLSVIQATVDAGSSSWWSSWRASSSGSASASASTEPPAPIVPFTPSSDPSAGAQGGLTEESREKLGWLLDAAKIPLGPYSGCWVGAVAALRARCGDMDHGTRQYLALRLTNCQLQMGGRKAFVCDAAENARDGPALVESMAKCLKQVGANDVAFQVFNDMWVVTDQVCTAVSHALWERQAQATITELGMRAVEAAGLLHETRSTSAAILQRQQEGLALQKEAAVLQGEVREGLAAARAETGRLSQGLEAGFGELLEQQRLMQAAQEQTGEAARQLLKDVERARAMHRETHEAVERGFEATRRHLDILSRFRRDVEDFCALLWRGLKPGLLFLLALRCLPGPLRPPARRLAALTFLSSLLWGVFLTGWDLNVDGPKYFRVREFAKAHAWLFALLGIAVFALVVLGPPERRSRAAPENQEDEAIVARKDAAAELAQGVSGSGEGGSAGGSKSNRARRRLPVGQERALRAAVTEVVSRTGSSAGRGIGGGAGRDLDGSAGGGGGAAALGGSHAGSALSSGVATPSHGRGQLLGSGKLTPQGSQRYYSADSSQAGTPLRRSPRIHSSTRSRRPPPPSSGLAAVAEGVEEE